MFASAHRWFRRKLGLRTPFEEMTAVARVLILATAELAGHAPDPEFAGQWLDAVLGPDRL